MGGHVSTILCSLGIAPCEQDTVQADREEAVTTLENRPNAALLVVDVQNGVVVGNYERDGLVDTHRAASNGGPPRKYYRLSREGQLALTSGVREWQCTRDAVDGVLGVANTEVSL